MKEIEVGEEFILHWFEFKYKKALVNISYNNENDKLELEIKLGVKGNE